jgi:large repetitive protein
LAQRPLVATVEVLGPFEVLKHPLTLRPKQTQSPAPGDPARGLVAWWKLNEADGREAADASGRQHFGRVHGPAGWAPAQGKFQGALNLDGQGTFVDCGDAAEFDFQEAFTVSLWFRTDSVKKTAQTLAGKGSDSWRLYADANRGRLVFALNGPQGAGKDRYRAPRITSKRAVADGQWHHVAGVYDGQRMALYLDGTLEGSMTVSGSLALCAEPLWLGNNPGARSEWFQGALDEVRLYACGLSEQDVKALRGGVRP